MPACRMDSKQFIAYLNKDISAIELKELIRSELEEFRERLIKMKDTSYIYMDTYSYYHVTDCNMVNLLQDYVDHKLDDYDLGYLLECINFSDENWSVDDKALKVLNQLVDEFTFKEKFESIDSAIRYLS